MPHTKYHGDSVGAAQGTQGTTILAFRGAPRLQNGDVEIGTLPTLIVDEDPTRRTVTVRNIGSNDVYLGGENVATGNGFPLAANTNLVLEIRGKVYGIVETGTENVRFLTEGDSA